MDDIKTLPSHEGKAELIRAIKLIEEVFKINNVREIDAMNALLNGFLCLAKANLTKEKFIILMQKSTDSWDIL